MHEMQYAIAEETARVYSSLAEELCKHFTQVQSMTWLTCLINVMRFAIAEELARCFSTPWLRFG